MKKKLIVLYVTLCSVACFSIKAQTTIGNEKTPVAGALLQLKQNENNTTNATKGMGLPRVNLTDIANLYPMFTSGSAAYTGAKKIEEDANHIGLILYNTNQCLKNERGVAQGMGLFVWDGTQWQPFNTLEDAYNSLQSETASNSNRADWQSTWGNKVIRHETKPNVYNEFISADFGAAGRWTTTNVAATAYDGIPHSQGTALTGPFGNSAGAVNIPYWAYPSIVDPVTNTEYNENKRIGYLYTWDAATAGKGGATGVLNIYSTVGSTIANNEENMKEGTIAGDQKRVQGICPLGWHLPSDREFTELANAIIANTIQYSSTPTIGGVSLSLSATQTVNNNPDWAKKPLGTAMKDVCGFNSIDPLGTSKPATHGGFAALRVGYTNNNKSYGYGDVATFWSSSSNEIPGTGYAWSRYIGDDRVGRQKGSSRNGMFSVRCKKDVD